MHKTNQGSMEPVNELASRLDPCIDWIHVFTCYKLHLFTHSLSLSSKTSLSIMTMLVRVHFL
jgi:hypothetical protein